jgi:hypothetical protein
MFSFVFLSTNFVDFIFVDFDKIPDKFIYLYGIFLGNYFLPTLPSGTVVLPLQLCVKGLKRNYYKASNAVKKGGD